VYYSIILNNKIMAKKVKPVWNQIDTGKESDIYKIIKDEDIDALIKDFDVIEDDFDYELDYDDGH
jgi:RIO-like serine/threonine protein kinase